jgi:threonine-phosphate decarboxylase
MPKEKSQLLIPDVGPRTPDSVFRNRQFHHGGNIHAFAHARGMKFEQVLDFSASINPFGCPPAAARAYRHALPRIVHYPEPYTESLTGALAAYHGLEPSTILVGNGSTQLIFLLARALTARRVLVIAPLFGEHEGAFRLSGARVDRFFLRPPDFTLSLARLGRVITQSYDVLILTNPNSPTGALVPRAQVEELARLCRRVGTKLLVDEAFIDWVEEDSIKQLAARSPQVIVLRSLTKFFALPGLRVGYLIGQARLVERLRTRLEPWSVNTVAQTVALACLRDSEFVRQSRAFMEQERAWLFEQVAELPGVQPFLSRTNFLLVKMLKSDMRASALSQALAQENLLVRTCVDFPGLGERFFRVAVRARQDNRRLLRGLRAVLLSRA